MKKIVFLLLLVILLTGCNVKYELNIDKSGFQENILLESENDSDNESIQYGDNTIEAFNDSPITSETNEKVPGVEYYNTNIFLENGYYKYNLDYKFNWQNFSNSYVVTNSTSMFTMEENEDIINFYVGSTIKAFELFNEINNLTITVNVSNDYEIISSNAPTQNGNTLTWQVNYDNHDYYPINFTLRDKEKTASLKAAKEKEEAKENSNYSFLIASILLFLFFIVIIIMLILKKKFNK